jgi:NADPH-dependent glutamate synthase beta subunit-like oxidoreductase
VSNAEKFKQMRKGFDLVQALAEADRCLLCHDAPCSEGCPADTRPAEFIRKLRFKNITGAIRTIKQNNIMGGACGVLCPTSRLCEEKCSAMFKSQNRPEGADRPIQIGKIQRFLVEHSWQIGFKPFAKPAAISCAARPSSSRRFRTESWRRRRSKNICKNRLNNEY